MSRLEDFPQPRSCVIQRDDHFKLWVSERTSLERVAVIQGVSCEASLQLILAIDLRMPHVETVQKLLALLQVIDPVPACGIKLLEVQSVHVLRFFEHPHLAT